MPIVKGDRATGGNRGQQGPVLFVDIASTYDLSGAALQWFKPAVTGAKYYPLGWETGLETHLVGCKLVLLCCVCKYSVIASQFLRI